MTDYIIPADPTRSPRSDKALRAKARRRGLRLRHINALGIWVLFEPRSKLPLQGPETLPAIADLLDAIKPIH